ncbi:hypothetical protein T484DRAFT_1832018 [Baffinella frigidus]|nr:hypothetical protein T484DRAFT_1832018 [Cryptophyta sp. CCMP2293]
MAQRAPLEYPHVTFIRGTDHIQLELERRIMDMDAARQAVSEAVSEAQRAEQPSPVSAQDVSIAGMRRECAG